MFERAVEVSEAFREGAPQMQGTLRMAMKAFCSETDCACIIRVRPGSRLRVPNRRAGIERMAPPDIRRFPSIPPGPPLWS